MKKLVNGELVEMTPDEVAERQTEEAKFQKLREQQNLKNSKQAAFAAKWPDAYALIDDILERGLKAVKADRDVIKGGQ